MNDKPSLAEIRGGWGRARALSVAAIPRADEERQMTLDDYAEEVYARLEVFHRDERQAKSGAKGGRAKRKDKVDTP